MYGIGGGPKPTGTEGGDGDSLVVVRVIEEEPAGIRVPEAVVIAEPMVANLSTVVLYTDDQGESRFHLHADIPYAIEVRSDNHVTVRERMSTPEQAGGEKMHEVFLLRDSKEVEIQAVWPGPVELSLAKATDGLAGEVEWRPLGGLFSENESVDQAYLSHLDRLEVHLTWENNLTVYADLGIGASGTDGDRPRYFHDEHDEQETSRGGQEEHMVLSSEEIGRQGLRSGDSLRVGPGTQHVLVAPFDLVAQMKVKAEFDEIEHQGAPGLSGLLLVLAAMGLLVWVRGSRR